MPRHRFKVTREDTHRKSAGERVRWCDDESNECRAAVLMRTFSGPSVCEHSQPDTFKAAEVT